MWTRSAALLSLSLWAAGCGGAPASQPTSQPGGHADEAGRLKHAGGVHHRFDDAEAWAKRFEDPRRDAWQRPDEVVAKVVWRPKLKIVDIGSGTGYFPVRFARAAPEGQVIGLDIEPAMVEYLNARAQREGLSNLSSRLVGPDDPKLGGDRPDLVFLCDTYHHLSDRTAYFRRVRAQMAEGGRLAIVDFQKSSKIGPPAKHKLAPEVVIGELSAAGWTLLERVDLPEQYLLILN